MRLKFGVVMALKRLFVFSLRMRDSLKFPFISVETGDLAAFDILSTLG